MRNIPSICYFYQTGLVNIFPIPECCMGSQESGVSHLLYMSGPGSDECHGVAGVRGGHDQGGGAGVNPDGPRCFHRLWAVDGSVEVVFPTVIIINVKRLKKKPRTCLKIINSLQKSSFLFVYFNQYFLKFIPLQNGKYEKL